MVKDNLIPKCAIPNGDTDISTVKALHQLIGKRNDSTKQGSTEQGVTVVLSGGNMDIETLAMMDAGCGDKLTHGQPERTAQGNIRVSNPVVTVIDERSNEPSNVIPSCDTLDDVIGVLIPAGKPPELIRQRKRGKDIKSFADLPPDVQHSINSMSKVDGKICPTVKANRTVIAINYQHLFPGRYNSTGVA